MSLIRKAEQLEINPKIKALIYGQAGMGKTTLALSAPKPLLFDFDGGVHRVNFGHLKGVDIVQITRYQDFIDVLDNEDLSPYETLVIDTGGKLLDYMAEHIVRRSPKLGRQNGMLTLQGYGERKAMFTSIVKKVSVMGKHILFVAHRETKQEGDDLIYKPIFGGSNYDSLVTELDLVGYMEANGRNRTITFDPTSRNDGKNTCNLPSVMTIPEIVNSDGEMTADNTFFSEMIIKPYIERLEQRTFDLGKYEEVVSAIKEEILSIEDAEGANQFVKRIDEIEHVGSSKSMARTLLVKRVSELGLKWNKSKKVYEFTA
jgi:hypothetical protein